MAAILDLNIVSTHNTKTLGVADISVYEPNQVISAATLEVTPPGFKKVALTFTPNTVNVINSNNLNITDTVNVDELVTLPDGIWLLKYSIQPSLTNFVQKKFLRIDNIQSKYYKILLSIDLDLCPDNDCLPTINHKDEQFIRLREIRLMIDGAISAVNNGEDLLAMNMYKRANSMLDRFNICKTCK